MSNIPLVLCCPLFFYNKNIFKKPMTLYYSDMYIFCISDHKLELLKNFQRLSKGPLHKLGLLCEDFFAYLWWQISPKLCKDLIFAHQFSSVFVYLMCSSRPIFVQCGPERPKVWTPLCQWLRIWDLDKMECM